MKSIIVIPARLASTRLPRKLLLCETGKTLLQHTYESACTSQLADSVIVAADDAEIVDEVQRFGGRFQLTDPHHVCGTDRVAEVAAQLVEYDLIVNFQGDEPELPGNAIDLAITIFQKHPEAQMATLATPIRERKWLDDPSCVKVVIDQLGRALYFSRAPIPWARTWDDRWLHADPPSFFQHIGLYVYRRDFLLRIPHLPAPQLEKIESLEQLRVLHAGVSIYVGLIDHPVVGIDTPADYAAFVRRQNTR